MILIVRINSLSLPTFGIFCAGLGVSYALTSFGAFGGPAFSSGILVLFQSSKIYGSLILWAILMILLYRMRIDEKAGATTAPV